MDYQNGNFDIKTDDIEDYTHENIVQKSIRNGQMKQAREQCDEYGLDYDSQISESGRTL